MLLFNGYRVVTTKKRLEEAGSAEPGITESTDPKHCLGCDGKIL
jgi:hypothetical protein